jgi:hypothetical protein
MRRRIVFVVAGLALGGKALAGDMSYSYLQVDLLGGQLDARYASISGSGAGLRGSLELGPWLDVVGGYSSTKYAGDGVKFKFVPRSAGVGAHASLSSALDVFGDATVQRLTIRTGAVGFGGYTDSQSFNGWGVRAGVRGWLGEKFQWTGDLGYNDFKQLQALVTIGVGGSYFFTPKLSLGMDFRYQKYDNYALAAHESIGSVNLRYSFTRLF